MSRATRLCRIVCNRHLRATLLCVLVVLVATGINVVAIRVFGGIDGWEHWLEQHRVHLLAWRLCIYGGTAYAWRWMRKRVLLRESDAGTKTRLRRVEAAAVAVIVALEVIPWLQAR